MTEKEKMQKLFEAALRAPAAPEAGMPTRAVPSPPAAVAVLQAPAPHPLQSSIEPTVLAAAQTPVRPLVNTGLDETTSSELAALLDAQNLRKQRKHRRDSLIAALILLVFVTGGCGWLISSPERLKALREAINDIRSVGDITAIVAKYDAALEKIKVRSTQIDSATSAMGVDPTKDDGKDPYFEKEMKDMARGEGRTVGERNRILREKFSSTENTGGKLALPAPAAPAPTPQPTH